MGNTFVFHMTVDIYSSSCGFASDSCSAQGLRSELSCAILMF